MKFLVSVLVAFALLHTVAQARSCSSNEYDKAEYFSEQAAQKIVSKYGGGDDIRMEMRSCSYNGYSEEFKTTINVYWNGALFGSNHYNVDGELKFRSDGTLIDFSKTYENEAVRDLKTFVGGVIVFAVLMDQDNHK